MSPLFKKAARKPKPTKAREFDLAHPSWRLPKRAYKHESKKYKGYEINYNSTRTGRYKEWAGGGKYFVWGPETGEVNRTFGTIAQAKAFIDNVVTRQREKMHPKSKVLKKAVRHAIKKGK